MKYQEKKPLEEVSSLSDDFHFKQNLMNSTSKFELVNEKIVIRPLKFNTDNNCAALSLISLFTC